MATVRTRFAPSPTGEMHLGNLRIAIFNHLFARGRGGAFVLRIEDTDSGRNVEGAIEGILDDLRWVGIDWDEGPDCGGDFGPYHQSERGAFHREAARSLEAEGLAYACFCTDEEVRAVRGEGAPGRGCPGGCDELGEAMRREREVAGVPSSLRFRVPEGEVVVRDAVRGEVHFDGADIGDFVILRADGRATYNFAVVVDDIGMEITHVIRGSGHLSNTPKQALLFDALGAPRPVFAHLPMVLGADRKKLAKREGAEGLRKLRTEGYHPEGVVNYLSLLGWSPGDDREIFGAEELAGEIDLERAGVADAVYDPEKMKWVSGQHIERMSDAELAGAVRPWVDPELLSGAGEERLVAAVGVIRDRLETFGGVREHLPLVLAPRERLLAGREEVAALDRGAELLGALRGRLVQLDGWEGGAIGGCVREVGAELGIRGAGLFHPVRLALTGVRKGPELGAVIEAIGRERVLELLEAAARACWSEGDRGGSSDVPGP